MTTIDIFALVLEIEQVGANVNVMYHSESRLLTVHVTFPKGHKYEIQERFYSISIDKLEDVEAKYKELRKIKEALK